jgi:hypothetical protein
LIEEWENKEERGGAERWSNSRERVLAAATCLST